MTKMNTALLSAGGFVWSHQADIQKIKDDLTESLTHPQTYLVAQKLIYAVYIDVAIHQERPRLMMEKKSHATPHFFLMKQSQEAKIPSILHLNAKNGSGTSK